jgi:vacuolar iron transporter family protein
MKEFLSEFIYGSIDGLVTTFSIVVSAIGAEFSNKVILILGVSNVLADGYSMGISRYLSSKAEINQNLSTKNSIKSGLITFVSFVIIGILPITPYIFLQSNIHYYSISIGLLLFCVIGLLKGLVTKTSLFRSIIETFLLGSSAACISYLVGYALKNITN